LQLPPISKRNLSQGWQSCEFCDPSVALATDAAAFFDDSNAFERETSPGPADSDRIPLGSPAPADTPFNRDAHFERRALPRLEDDRQLENVAAMRMSC